MPKFGYPMEDMVSNYRTTSVGYPFPHKVLATPVGRNFKNDVESGYVSMGTSTGLDVSVAPSVYDIPVAPPLPRRGVEQEMGSIPKLSRLATQIVEAGSNLKPVV